MTLALLQKQVGGWSAANFDQNQTPYLAISGATPNCKQGVARNTKPPQKAVGVRACLGNLASLMGISEELGELATAPTHGDMVDAVADMGIYLLDYCTRSHIDIGSVDCSPFPIASPSEDEDDSDMQDHFAGLVGSVGALHHAELKRHQNIRGMHMTAAYVEARSDAVGHVLYHLGQYAEEHCEESLESVVGRVWSAIVAKRDWKDGVETEG